MIRSDEILCRLCIDAPVDEKELVRYLDEYVSSLPEDEKCPEEQYKSRLEQCAACPERIRYTCRKCGCYVQARAGKLRMHCPLPGKNRW